jgi:hypothetical protein
LVIAVPDEMKTDPIDLQWINEHNPFECRINRLGRPLWHERFTINNERYREIIFNMIAVGIKVISYSSLAETNAKYLEVSARP